MRILSLLAMITLMWSCTEETMEPVIASSTITVECSEPKGTAFGVEQDLVFSINLETDPSVGINSFTIEKGNEELFNKSDYTANIVQFSFGYKTTSEDLEAGSVPFIFTLVDGNNATKTQQIDVEVAVDLPIFIPQIDPDPAWDLVSDMSVDSTAEATADIFEYSTGEGFSFTIWWKSLNGSKIYDVSDLSFNYFDFNLPYADLETAIADRTPLDSIKVGGASGQFPRPLIVEISRNNELVLIDFSNIQGSMVGYRKREN